MHWAAGLLCWAAVALALAFAVCRMLGLWTHASSWIKSSKEEKVNLTRAGIYNANGFLIKGDIDDCGNEYHHLDAADGDYPMTTMTVFPIKRSESSIPPQPLRPAPIIIPQESRKSVSKETIAIDDGIIQEMNTFTIEDESIPIKQTNVEVAKEKTPTNLDEIVTLEGDEENDWTVRNNLNMFRKPSYRSTNPFVAGGSHMNGQFNPFYSRTFSQDSLTEIKQTNNDENDFNVSSRRYSLIRKRSFDYDYEIDENTVNDPIIKVGNAGSVKRAISCDSVSSDTSLGPLESPLPTVTGQLCLSLRCFRINANDTVLAVNVIEARNLEGDNPDTYVAIFLSPEIRGEYYKTKICHGTNCPSFNETFIIDIGKSYKKLCFHVYDVKNDACTMTGEAELSLQDASSYKQPVTTWLTLTDAGHELAEHGEMMLSLSYLPTAERLTLILTRARRLPDPTNYNVFIKVYLQRNGKKVGKKRSSIKRSEATLTFNEAFIFSVPPQMLSTVELRITLVYFPIGTEFTNLGCHKKMGHIVLCRDAPGKAGNHWNQMIISIRKPVSMWHTLRKQHR